MISIEISIEISIDSFGDVGLIKLSCARSTCSSGRQDGLSR